MGPEFGTFLLKTSLKDNEERFNNIIRKALATESGVDEFQLQVYHHNSLPGSDGCPGSQGQENRIGSLFHNGSASLAGDVIGLITTQNLVNFSIIFVIASYES